MRIHAPRSANRRAHRAAPLPRTVGQPAVAPARPAPTWRPGGDHPGGDRDLSLVPRGDGPQRRTRSRDRGDGSAPGRSDRRRRRHAPRDRQARGVRGPRTGGPCRDLDRGAPSGAARARSPAWVRDGRHMCRRVRSRDALLLLDLCRRGVGARGTAGPASRRPGDRVRARPDRAGDRVRLLRRPGRRHAPPRRTGAR